jgi:hypothetical protein
MVTQKYATVKYLSLDVGLEHRSAVGGSNSGECHLTVICDVCCSKGTPMLPYSEFQDR